MKRFVNGHVLGQSFIPWARTHRQGRHIHMQIAFGILSRNWAVDLPYFRARRFIFHSFGLRPSVAVIKDAGWFKVKRRTILSFGAGALRFLPR